MNADFVSLSTSCINTAMLIKPKNKTENNRNDKGELCWQTRYRGTVRTNSKSSSILSQIQGARERENKYTV